jgi:hypothetical protein|tara:strand:+ start:328 stop:573 length:246 start_codon:yes stop_codon:yes gene_type:complete
LFTHEKLARFAQDYPYSHHILRHLAILFLGLGVILLMGLILFVLPYIAVAALLIFVGRSFMKGWDQLKKNPQDDIIDVDVE